jgi:hypothetical protein
MASDVALRGEVESFQGVRVRDRIAKSLGTLTRADLDAARQHPRRGTITGRDVLIVVARHAAEHWGEAQLTRSLMKARAGGRQP